MNSSISEQICQAFRISENRVFTTRDISNATLSATRELVDQVISRMVRSGELQRVSRGLFSLPKIHVGLGPLPPATDDMAAAVERSIGVPVTPTESLALNALHLSTQVPSKPEFLTAGPSRTIYVRNLTIRMKNASARRFLIHNRTVRLIIEALRALGRDQVTEATIRTIRLSVSEPAADGDNMKFQDIALLTVDERSDYIRAAAAETGLGELIVEKNFWVVWLLEQLFALSSSLGPFMFKDGTSLSILVSAIHASGS